MFYFWRVVLDLDKFYLGICVFLGVVLDWGLWHSGKYGTYLAVTPGPEHSSDISYITGTFCFPFSGWYYFLQKYS
jgi:hypothetical protein